MNAAIADDPISESLSDLGHSPSEIHDMMRKLEAHDRRTFRDVLFNSIEDGTFDLDAIVEEAKSSQD